MIALNDPSAHEFSRKTHWRVRWIDRVARLLVTFAGFSTILAIVSMCVFLVWVVVPLFLKPTSVEQPRATLSRTSDPGSVRRLEVDEHGMLAASIEADGTLVTFSAADGRLVERLQWFDPQPAACSYSPTSGDLCAGFADGTCRTGRVEFETTQVKPDEVPETLRALAINEHAVFDGSLWTRPKADEWQQRRVSTSQSEPATLCAGRRIVRIDASIRPRGPIIACVADDGIVRISTVESKTNLLTGEVTTQARGGQMPVPGFASRSMPDHLCLSGIGDSVYLVWNDGTCVRLDTRELSNPEVAEQLDLVEDPAATVTAIGFLIGKTTLVVGDSTGVVRTWFRVKPKDSTVVDGAELRPVATLCRAGCAVTSLSASHRTRLLAAGFADGVVRLFHVTSQRQLAELKGAAAAIEAIAIAPKDDALCAISGDEWLRWSLDVPHPETTLSSIFRKVWYEGYEKPEHVWQSSSGSDEFEPKLGLAPLIFGTLKATLYSMLFAVPLALLAAIYASEFLGPRLKSHVKPAIEMMAGLPSVVLGFLAALVLAPFVAKVVPEVLACFVTLPVTLLLVGHLVQLLPEALASRVKAHRLPLLFAALPLGILFGAWTGPVIERLWFAGDLMSWLDGQRGTGLAAWLFLLLPLSSTAAVACNVLFVSPRISGIAGRCSRQRLALVDLARFALSCAATLSVAWLLAYALSSLGWDPRGGAIGTYVQRNALIVGFVMGFAVIPIIFTVSEDALTAVPEQLRAASLGCGATPWQSAVRVVLPTAMSGLFSALMIGLGRAVGETMIVLMAAGNTPVLEWNVFNGFRTLSANIATELPEAVEGGTTYRMLFLAALCLFVLTFVLNTSAEIVRMRFRRKAFEL